ncbi:hypothetical protein IFM47457_04204 [Aspergillus lentulus]|nr:hypothetical protein IFM47457_04204 [Aspergillus lentulus]
MKFFDVIAKQSSEDDDSHSNLDQLADDTGADCALAVLRGKTLFKEDSPRPPRQLVLQDLPNVVKVAKDLHPGIHIQEHDLYEINLSRTQGHNT